MTTRAWGEEYRTTTVCIDSYRNGEMSGRFYNPYLAEGRRFENLIQFLLAMEQTLDAMNFPQAYTVTRTFADTSKEPAGEPKTEFRKGKRGTFVVKILFRQNASWQGSVVWQEGGREQSFRSVLELLLLMETAINQEKAS